jgi:hypothetical protein
MALNLSRRDTPRAIAAVKGYLNSKDLIVEYIDDINSGNDCLYHSLRISLARTSRVIPDRLCQMIDGRQQPEKKFKDMTPQEMRQAAARTIEWLWHTDVQGYGDTREVLRVHMDTEVREYLQLLGRIDGGVEIGTGTGLGGCAESDYVMQSTAAWGR